MTDRDERDDDDADRNVLAIPPRPSSPTEVPEHRTTKTPKEKEKELHVAPMLDYSKREFRAFLSILSTRAVLWTDMIVDDTVAHSPKLDDHLSSDHHAGGRVVGGRTGGAFGNRVVCQIGGNDPELCSRAVKAVTSERYGYGEVNLNVDCPSDRVSGRREFGAALMKNEEACVEVVKAMVRAAEGGNAPPNPKISVKCRIGVDDHDSLAFASQFIDRLRTEAECTRFVLHARKCVLGGLMSARENRSVPPLNYPRVYDLCRRFPDCEFWINGGVKGLKEAYEICYGGTKGEREDEDDEDGKPEEEEDFPSDGTPDDSYDDETGNTVAASTAAEEKKEADDSGARIYDGSRRRRRLRHAVPCSLCDHPNGSCVAPPHLTQPIPGGDSVSGSGPGGSVPPNLRGVMLGRLALTDPSAFWDVDRYFYGLPTNPCQNRVEVLTKYAEYLEGLYPRRCGDDCEEATWKIPAPQVVRVRECCEVCREFYGQCDGDDGSSDGSEEGRSKKGETNEAATSPPPPTRAKGKAKISARIIGRSLKPVRGVFLGLKGSKAFVRELDRLGTDVSVRNCGPGYILRKAMQAVPSEALRRDFVRTEDLPQNNSGPKGREVAKGRLKCCGL